MENIMSPQNVGVFFNISKYRLLVISYYKLFGTGKALKSLLGLMKLISGSFMAIFGLRICMILVTY